MSIFLRDHYGISQLSAKQILSDPVLFTAFGFGSGLSKFMPGTMGTIAAIPIYLLIANSDLWLYLLIILISFLIGIPLCDKASEKLAIDDYGGIVWDEIVGLLITLCGITYSWQSLLAGFVLFRFFDIVKPWPIKWLDQHIKGGLGIMVDDVLAGIFAALVLRIWF